MKPLDGRADPPDGAASRVPFWTLAATLAGLAAFFLIRPALQPLPYYHPRPGGRTYDYWPLVMAAFVPYAWALRAAGRGMRVPVPLVLGVAAVLYAALIPAPAQQSQDVYQYLIYGKMAAAGVSPYAVLPDQFGGPWLAFSSWHHTATVYGPVWTFLSLVAVKLGGGLTGAFLLIKAMAAALALTAAAGLGRGTAPGETRPFAALAFALNPLVVFSVGLGAHADVAIAAAFAWAVVADRRRRPGLTTALLAAAALVKPYGGIGLAVWLIALWRRRGMRVALGHAGATAAVAVATYAPFWGGPKSFRGLAEIGGRTSASLVGTLVRILAANPDSANAGATAAGTFGRVIALAALGAGFVWAARRLRSTDADPWRVAAGMAALYVLVTPWYLYWHLLGALALALALASGDGALIAGTLTFGATSMIVLGGGRTTFAQTVVLLAQTSLRYVPPFAAGLAVRRAYTPGNGHRDPGGDRGGLRGGHRPPRGAGTTEGPGDA